MRILLHCCCAVCASGCIKRLKEEGFEVYLFYDNPNIFDDAEREKRFSNLHYLASLYKVKCFQQKTRHEEYLERVKGFENEKERGERCKKCFNFNFSLTSEFFKKAKSFDVWTTSLTVSRYKDTKMIFKEALNFPNFYEIDFKKNNGEAESNRISNAIGLYRQKYCGCEFSMRKDDAF